MSIALVTGGSGFIGSHLVERLIQRGDQVRVLARRTSDTELLERVGAEVVEGDLTYPASVTRAVDGADIVFHSGAVVSDWAPPGAFEAVNAGGTRNVVTAARSAGARLVHISSTDVYGFPDQGSLNESYGRHRRGWGYVDTKIAAEEAVEDAVREGLDAVIIRPASVYGPRCPYFVVGCAQLMQNGLLSFIGEGRATGGFIFVEDLVRLIVLAGDRAESGEVFNATGGRKETWKQYFDGLARVTGVPPITTNKDKDAAFREAEQNERRALADPSSGDPPLTRHAWAMYATDQDFSIDKARRLLGWESSIDLEQGLNQVGVWWAKRSTHR